MKIKALLICYSDHSREPRLQAEIKALKNTYDITTAGFEPLHDDSIAFIKLSQHLVQPKKFKPYAAKPVLIRKAFSFTEKIYLKFFRRKHGYFFSMEDYRVLARKKFGLIIAHHPDSIELAQKLAKNYKAKLVLNCHEYYPLEFDNNPVWMKYDRPVIEKILHKAKANIDLWLTVSAFIQQSYERNFGARCFYCIMPNLTVI